MCLDLFQPNGLEHLGGFKTVLRADTKDRPPSSSPSTSLCWSRKGTRQLAYLQDAGTGQLVQDAPDNCGRVDTHYLDQHSECLWGWAGQGGVYQTKRHLGGHACLRARTCRKQAESFLLPLGFMSESTSSYVCICAHM